MIIEDLEEKNESLKPFDYIKKADDENIFYIIKDELPQTIALILNYLTPEKSANVLSKFPFENFSLTNSLFSIIHLILTAEK